MKIMPDYKLKTGCIPCSFICNCCDLQLYRCSSGADMYYKGDSSRFTSIICGECYRYCHTSPHCEVRRQYETLEETEQ